MLAISKMSDAKLIESCRELGLKIVNYRKKFGALLLEVYERGIYKRKFSTIYEFAARYAGMNRETVAQILRLGSRLTNKPLLKATLPEVGWSKIKEAMPLLKTKSEAEVVRLVKDLPKLAIRQYKKDIQNPSTYKPPTRHIKIQAQTDKLFRLAKYDLEKKLSVKLTDDEFISKLLQMSTSKTNQQTKQQIHETHNKQPKVVTRYIPKKLRQITLQKTNRLCAKPNCNRIAKHLHHKIPFAQNPKHIDNLEPLCKTCHQLKHLLGKTSIDTKYRKHFWQNRS